MRTRLQLEATHGNEVFDCLIKTGVWSLETLVDFHGESYADQTTMLQVRETWTTRMKMSDECMKMNERKVERGDGRGRTWQRRRTGIAAFRFVSQSKFGT
jgi:hypothetical protein